MSKQLLASFKKEFLLFIRTYKLLAISLVFIAFAILDPSLVKAMKSIAGWYDDMLNTITEEANMDFEFSMESMMDIAYGQEPNVSIGVTNTLADMTGTVLIVMLIILNFVAGGEQKKRSTIIPTRAGLRTLSYTLPKFIIYPLATFIITIVALFVSYLVSIILFSENDLNTWTMLVCGMFLGLYIAFFTVTHLFIGISTGRPGLSSVICIVISLLMPTILSILDIVDKYNPFALIGFAQYSLYAGRTGASSNDVYSFENILVTVIVTLLTMAIMFFLTMFIQTAKKIDNRAKNTLL